jgi:hypothetical protein
MNNFIKAPEKHLFKEENDAASRYRKNFTTISLSILRTIDDDLANTERDIKRFYKTILSEGSPKKLKKLKKEYKDMQLIYNEIIETKIVYLDLQEIIVNCSIEIICYLETNNLKKYLKEKNIEIIDNTVIYYIILDIIIKNLMGNDFHEISLSGTLENFTLIEFHILSFLNWSIKKFLHESPLEDSINSFYSFGTVTDNSSGTSYSDIVEIY